MSSKVAKLAFKQVFVEWLQLPTTIAVSKRKGG